MGGDVLEEKYREKSEETGKEMKSRAKKSFGSRDEENIGLLKPPDGGLGMLPFRKVGTF